VRELIIPCGLRQAQVAGFDLLHQLALEIDFEFSTNLSHYEYWSPRPSTEHFGGREGLWKMPQLWKSTKVAFGRFLMISTSCLEKPPQKTLRLSHIYHSPGGCCR
jgi:hypothetical protein